MTARVTAEINGIDHEDMVRIFIAASADKFPILDGAEIGTGRRFTTITVETTECYSRNAGDMTLQLLENAMDNIGLDRAGTTQIEMIPEEVAA